jgi:hypothetical protein
MGGYAARKSALMSRRRSRASDTLGDAVTAGTQTPVCKGCLEVCRGWGVNVEHTLLLARKGQPQQLQTAAVQTPHPFGRLHPSRKCRHWQALFPGNRTQARRYCRLAHLCPIQSTGGRPGGSCPHVDIIWAQDVGPAKRCKKPPGRSSQKEADRRETVLVRVWPHGSG